MNTADRITWCLGAILLGVGIVSLTPSSNGPAVAVGVCGLGLLGFTALEVLCRAIRKDVDDE